MEKPLDDAGVLQGLVEFCRLVLGFRLLFFVKVLAEVFPQGLADVLDGPLVAVDLFFQRDVKGIFGSFLQGALVFLQPRFL